MTDTGRQATPGPTRRRPAVLALARRVVMYELGMWRSLYRWVLRRPLRLAPGAEAFGYATTVTPVILVFIGVSAVEVPLAHLILPWETARNTVLFIGVYGLLWMIGMLASLRVYPHVLDDAGLRVRYSATVDFTIPWEAVAAVRTKRRALPGRTIQLDRSAPGLALCIGISRETTIDVTFREPRTIPLPKGLSEPVTELRFHADKPAALVARARRHLTAGT